MNIGTLVLILRIFAEEMVIESFSEKEMIAIQSGRADLMPYMRRLDPICGCAGRRVHGSAARSPAITPYFANAQDRRCTPRNLGTRVIDNCHCS